MDAMAPEVRIASGVDAVGRDPNNRAPRVQLLIGLALVLEFTVQRARSSVG